MQADPPAPLQALAAQAESLYTLPSVAMEVLRLTDSPEVDTRMLKECIERDPALTAKILRVVNSSLFGLSGNIENLTQAIALLGIEPLKLLVLGFSLPANLLESIEAEQLERYWRLSLTRAVAARDLATGLWHTLGDECFLVALLQNIGMLVMLQQLGTPYANFLSQVRGEHQDIVKLEDASLGFDHRALTVCLLRSWKLPAYFSDSIDTRPRRDGSLGSHEPEHVVPQVLTLANLLAELVGHHRLDVLPALLEAGADYCQLTKQQLNDLVVELQPKVERLAEVLEVDIGRSDDYRQILLDAHERLSPVAELAAKQLLADDKQAYDHVLTEAEQLRQSVDSFMKQGKNGRQVEAFAESKAHGAQPEAPRPRSIGYQTSATTGAARDRLEARVKRLVRDCRNRRQSLALALIETEQAHNVATVRLSLEQMLDQNQLAADTVLPVAGNQLALLLPEHDRRETVGLVQQVIDRMEADPDEPVELKVGVAFVAQVPKSFEADRLVESAERCLAAACTSGGSAVKSIEVY